MSSDIDWMASSAYAQGKDPIDYAAEWLTTLIETHHDVMVGRAKNPASFPGYCLAVTDEALALRIVGELLDAGWTPPNVTTEATA